MIYALLCSKVIFWAFLQFFFQTVHFKKTENDGDGGVQEPEKDHEPGFKLGMQAVHLALDHWQYFFLK